MNSPIFRRYWPVLSLLMVLRLIFWLGAFPNPDEAYYWLWGQHLDWSYFDHPPLHAWVQGLFTTLFGRSHFVLRLPNLISTGLLLGLYWKICHRLYNRHGTDAFWLTVLLVMTSPLFFLFLAMAWHDHWLILFGTTASYCLVQFLHRDRPWAYRWLYATGLLIGLAGLCKYVALFLGIGFLVAIASHPRWRSLLRNGHLYGAIVLALLVMTPVFIWNWQHDFYSFRFYLGRSVSTEVRTIYWFGPLSFLLLSAAIFGPVHSGLIYPSHQQTLMTPWQRTYQRVAVIIFGTSTFLLAALSLKAPVLYYWNILAYPLLFPLMAGVLRPRQRRHHSRRLQGAIALGTLAATLLVFHYTVVPISALIADTGDDDTRMLFGWSAIATAVQAQAATLSDPQLFTTDYRSAAALAYALNDPTVLAVSGRLDQFDFWFDAKALSGKESILLGDRWHPICPDHLDLFTDTSPPVTLPVDRFGIVVKTYALITGTTLRPTISPLNPDYVLNYTTDGEVCAPGTRPVAPPVAITDN